MKWSVDVIMKTIGLPAAAEYYKKFLLKRNKAGRYIFDNVDTQTSMVETTCLLPTDDGIKDIRVQSRGKDDNFTYDLEYRSDKEGEYIRK